ncbi:type II secretion system minor pseudopilin GspJ [Psychromonas sp. Urea-02u-13]|uniref:type II secretion system minor pseudopilin GspJ n=1 Tax=Psychromonas sp. Urea-02u-13 TaxID=2058326 RepID=UPI000C33FA74|nr:type II secretion system minor pseudopilin GspJ [Psychromonas sp. Urea-02u-13]PKG40075.1 type II secretion system protein GspJ [Psychromonas sp. Urea-02u-13]
MQNRNAYRATQGFTLLEVLIAISIFAVMSMVSYQVLQGVIRSGEISKRHSDELLKIQRAMLIIEQDFTQIIARASRDESGDSDQIRVLSVGKSLFESEDEGIEFTRLGWANPLGLLPRSNLLRVRYRLFDGQLQRLYFLYPDIVAGQVPETQVLLENIEKLSFRFWSDGWKTTWTEKSKLPSGIETTFTSKQFGEINRQFLVSESEVLSK